MQGEMMVQSSITVLRLNIAIFILLAPELIEQFRMRLLRTEKYVTCTVGQKGRVLKVTHLRVLLRREPAAAGRPCLAKPDSSPCCLPVLGMHQLTATHHCKRK